MPKATAIFYGNISDTLGKAIPGVAIFAEDNLGSYSGEGITDGNGNYISGVLGGTSTWQLGIDNSHLFPNYVFSQGHEATASDGEAIPYDFTALLATNHLNGNVQFNGSPVTGVGVNISATVNGVGFQPATTHTTTNGDFSFNVGNGNWSVSLNCSGGNDSLNSILGSGRCQCPVNQDITIDSDNATADFQLQPQTTLMTITEPTFTGGQFEWTLNGAAGLNVTVQFSTDLTNWVALFGVYIPSDPFTFTFQPGTNRTGFYRSRLGL